MALPKFLLFFIFTSLCYAVIASMELSDSIVDGDVIGVISRAEASDDSGRVELDQLKASDASLRDELDELNSRISFIGSKVDKRMQEVKSKEKTIKELEMIIKEKSDILTALQCQVQLLKEKASLNAKVQKVRAYSSAQELEGQTKYIQKEIEAQNKKKDALEARVTIAERKIQDLLSKLENLHRTNAEQKSKILSTQHALLVAEEELMKVKLEGVSKQMIEVREDWIPPWLAVYIDLFQSFVMSNWNKHGRPALDLIKEKAWDKKSEFEKWLRPHVDIFKSAARNSIDPNVLKLQQCMHPYFQEVQKFMEPYVKKFLHGYEEFARNVNVLHQQLTQLRDTFYFLLETLSVQGIISFSTFLGAATLKGVSVQATILDLLKSHEFTKPLATKESVWYMASALMAVPLIFLFNMVCVLFLEKPKEHVRTSHSSHTSCRAKLVNSER